MISGSSLIKIIAASDWHLAAQIRNVLEKLSLDVEVSGDPYTQSGLLKNPEDYLKSDPQAQPEPLKEPGELFENPMEHIEDAPEAPARGKKTPLLENPLEAL